MLKLLSKCALRGRTCHSSLVRKRSTKNLNQSFLWRPTITVASEKQSRATTGCPIHPFSIFGDRQSATLRPIAFPIATMKRKLDKNNEPSSPVQSDKETIGAQTEPVQAVEENQKSRAEPSFAELGLDPRLVQAIAKQNFEKPTLVQRKAIPLALKGQDVLCKAKTGSGKTAAYVLPVLSGILKRKTVGSPSYRSRVSMYRLETDPASIFRPTEPLSPPH